MTIDWHELAKAQERLREVEGVKVKPAPNSLNAEQLDALTNDPALRETFNTLSAQRESDNTPMYTDHEKFEIARDA